MKKMNVLLVGVIVLLSLSACTKEQTKSKSDVKTGIFYIDEQLKDLQMVNENVIGIYLDAYMKLLPGRTLNSLTKEEQIGIAAYSLKNNLSLTKDEFSLYMERMFGTKDFELKEGTFTIGDQNTYTIKKDKELYSTQFKFNSDSSKYTYLYEIQGIENNVLHVQAKRTKGSIQSKSIDVSLILDHGYLKIESLKQTFDEHYDLNTGSKLLDQKTNSLESVTLSDLEDYLTSYLRLFPTKKVTDLTNEDQMLLAVSSLLLKNDSQESMVITQDQVSNFGKRYLGNNNLVLKEGTYKVGGLNEFIIKANQDTYTVTDVKYLQFEPFKHPNNQVTFNYLDQLGNYGGIAFTFKDLTVKDNQLAVSVDGKYFIHNNDIPFVTTQFTFELVDGYLQLVDTSVNNIVMPKLESSTGLKWIDQPVTLSKITKEDLTSYLDFILTAYYDKNISEFTYEQMLTTAYVNIHGFNTVPKKYAFTDQNARIFAERYFGVKDFKVKLGRYQLLDVVADASNAFVLSLGNQYIISMCECEIWEYKEFDLNHFDIKDQQVTVYFDVKHMDGSLIGKTTVYLELINGHLVVKRMEYKPL